MLNGSFVISAETDIIAPMPHLSKAVTRRLQRGGDTVEIIILLGVTAVGGIIGTVVGGLILDYIRNRTK